VFQLSTNSCTTIVSDIGQPPLITPTGTVTLTSAGHGFFPLGPTCTLSTSGFSQTVSAPITFSPGVSGCLREFTTTGNGVPNLTGSYGGDSRHLSSSAQTMFLTVGAVTGLPVESTPAPPGGFSNSVSVGVEVPSSGTQVDLGLEQPGSGAAHGPPAGSEQPPVSIDQADNRVLQAASQAAQDLSAAPATPGHADLQPGAGVVEMSRDFSQFDNAVGNQIEMQIGTAHRVAPGAELTFDPNNPPTVTVPASVTDLGGGAASVRIGPRGPVELTAPAGNGATELTLTESGAVIVHDAANQPGALRDGTGVDLNVTPLLTPQAQHDLTMTAADATVVPQVATGTVNAALGSVRLGSTRPMLELVGGMRPNTPGAELTSTAPPPPDVLSGGGNGTAWDPGSSPPATGLSAADPWWPAGAGPTAEAAQMKRARRIIAPHPLAHFVGRLAAGIVRIKLPLNARQIARLAGHRNRVKLVIVVGMIVPSPTIKSGVPFLRLLTVTLVRGSRHRGHQHHR
jgi:hypothetical protein